MNKKLISVAVMAILLLNLCIVSVFAAYPVSIELKIAAPADGAILTGELIGTLGWGDSEDVDYRAAFDGDEFTFFDPAGVGEENYAGVKLDKAYVLTEVRVHPRSGFLDRFNGATIQGSNDGTAWTDLFISEAAAEEEEFQIITAAMLTNNTGWSYYRYVNNTIHGDCAEVEFWGKPAAGDAAPAENVAPAATPKYAHTIAASGETTIEAEDYMAGGEGAAFHETDSSGNHDYRNEGPGNKSNAPSSNGFSVGWTVAGEWINYDITVEAAGNYNFKAWLTTDVDESKTITFKVGDVVIGTAAVPKNGWEIPVEVNVGDIELAAGKHTLQAFMDTGDTDMDKFVFTSLGGAAVVTPAADTVVPVAPVTTAPPTGDMSIVLYAALILLAGITTVIIRRQGKEK